MSIGVQSFPELYTTLLGWDLYDKLWLLLTQTGLAYLPFIGMIIRNFTSAYINDTKHAGHARRSMEVSLIGTLLVIFFCASPVLPLDAKTVSYSPLCAEGSEKATYFPGQTDTTYDKAFSVPTGDIRVPIWWYVVLSVSEGMTHAANTLVGCTPDLRKMVTEVNMSYISDPEIKEELQDFESTCFIPARTQLLQDKKTNNASHLSRVQDDINKHGVSDTEWLGSHSFSDVYYQNIKAMRPIPGFPYIASQDINSDVSDITMPQYGTPDCNAWWNDSEHGLKSRILKSLPYNFLDDYKNYISDESRDDLTKKLVSHAYGYTSANSTVGDVGYSHLAAAAGILFNQLEEYPKLYAAQQAVPIIQALILMMIYTFLPFVLIFSSYRPSSVITGAIIIFSVIFWSWIWHLVQWVDKSLMQALYVNWFAQQGPQATLADMIIASLIIFAPLFWFLLMGTMGIAAGNVIGNTLGGLNRVGESAAQSGAGVAKAGAKSAVGALL